MRLLNVVNLQLEEFWNSYDTPPYGIISHVWTSEEVIFEDILENRAHKKTGFAKIKFFTQQAEADGLGYIWIDTCCLPKTSSAELTEAINSMFRWFAEAEKCYVHLADVFLEEEPHIFSPARWDRDFRHSRWFTRGWTLQELIAPRISEFYSLNWIKIGSKANLVALISEITHIPTEVLTHLKRPDEYSVPERMAWAAGRQTTRIEDQAYCLLGLFGVSMPLLYGEQEKAFQRLQKEIMSLQNQMSGLRLLVVDSAPLAIETFGSQDEPEYAILSHTWNTNEVSFQDIMVGKAPERRGYQKIKNCCEKAAQDGFKYLWVDTCCIDKSSSAELQEAICSMYKWYKNAKVCYVYLEDFETEASPSSKLSSCRWFTRGWTLQELIAPSIIKFYDSKWKEFGTKDTLCSQISIITGIEEYILRGGDPTIMTVAERMSWASKRSTSRIEDAAYSLMGLFNVFMPMLYGEGSRAFIRLQEEIMKQLEDNTIFAWKANPSALSVPRGLFAKSPAEFNDPLRSQVGNSYSSYLANFLIPEQQLHSPATLTSRGILIALPVWEKPIQNVVLYTLDGVSRISKALPKTPKANLTTQGYRTYLALICRKTIETRNNREHIFCIWLQKDNLSGVFTRILPEIVVLLAEDLAREFEIQSIYVKSDY